MKTGFGNEEREALFLPNNEGRKDVFHLNNEEREALFLLNNVDGLYSDKLMKIWNHFGSFAEAYGCDVNEYFRAGIFHQERMRDAYRAVKNREEVLLERYKHLQREGIRMVTMFDTDYPQRLTAFEDRPVLLYVCGKLPDEERRTAGIIGARKCSDYGRTVAEFFAGELAAKGIQIVSGLAYGIDGCAALGSLKTAKESYGVLGSGVNVCYPYDNMNLYKRMKQGEGGVMSEFPPDAKPLGYHFVMRNRIISGLSDLLIVIEAAEKSGTATTVEYALNQGKEVFALPGRITDPLGFGCNRLIRDGANVLTSPSDVLEYFGMENSSAVIKLKPKDLSLLTNVEKRVYKALGVNDQHVEFIAGSCDLSLGETMMTLLQLEKKGFAVSQHNAYYRRSI